MTILRNTQWIRKQKALPGTFGLEIETETMDRYPLEGNARIAEFNFPEPNKLDFWKIVEDHSLRNIGYEYVLTKPLDFISVGAALSEFKDKSNKMGIKFLQDRHSTSVHVHLNMQRETFRTLGNFCASFILFEEALVQYCGEDRTCNFFCITSRYAEGVTKRFTNFFHNVNEGSPQCLTKLDEENSKYSSLNIVPLYKQGSIEVRTMRGVTDVAVIYNWVGMLNSLLEFARQDITPYGIINLWRQEGLELFRDVFGKYAKLLEDEGTYGLIDHNLWAASCIAATVPDWTKIDLEMTVKQAEYDEKMKKGVGMVDAGYGVRIPPQVAANWADVPLVIQDEDEEFL